MKTTHKLTKSEVKPRLTLVGVQEVPKTKRAANKRTKNNPPRRDMDVQLNLYSDAFLDADTCFKYEPVMVHPDIIQITKNALASLMLAHLFSMHEEIHPDYEGWIHIPTSVWTNKAGMSEFEQRQARKILLDLELIEECIAAGRLYIRVSFREFQHQINLLSVDADYFDL